MKLKKSKRIKYRYIVIKSYLNEPKLESYLKIVLGYKFSEQYIFNMRICLIKLDYPYYLIKVNRTYVPIIRFIVNILPFSNSLKIYHSIYKYKQVESP